MISPRIVTAALALSLFAPVVQAQEGKSILLQSAAELEAANDAGQVKEGASYAFGQNLPVFDIAPDRSALYGLAEPLTPSYGTTPSFPARTFQQIPESQSTFGLAIRF